MIRLSKKVNSEKVNLAALGLMLLNKGQQKDN